MTRRSIIIALIGISALAGIGFHLFSEHPEPAARMKSTAASTEEQSTPVARAPAGFDPSRIAMRAPDVSELSEIKPHPLADAIRSDKVPPGKEITFVLELFQAYRREFGAFPAGQTNAHFMNALRGANPGKLLVFPMEHPRLDAAGNLLDRWGQPYQFHPVSRDRLEIRSAGEDKQLFTADDLVVPPQERR